MAYGRKSSRSRSSYRAAGRSSAVRGRRSTGRATRRTGNRGGVSRRTSPTVKVQLQIVQPQALATSPLLGDQQKETPKGRAKF